MKLEWMGRYRELLAALVLHGNVVSRTQSDLMDLGEGIFLTSQQWQIFEYLVEHRDHRFSMNDISYRLNIPQSTFSKTVKILLESGLVEKYQAVNNRKNIILHPTEKGLVLYKNFSENNLRPMFERIFHTLDHISDEDLHSVAMAIVALDNELLPERKEEVEIIKV